jgi:soluble lytic murein transglycosylase-like protein
MDIATLFITIALQLNLPPKLLSSICYVESKYDTAAIHYNDGKTHSYGVCQIKYSTAKWLGFKGTPAELMEPKNNIYYAGLYLKHQIKRYNGSIEKAIIAYNMGGTRHLTSTKYQGKVLNRYREELDEQR